MGRHKITGEDILGKVYGKLTVIKVDHRRNGYMYYLCKCSCNNIHIAKRTALLDGRTFQCLSCTRNIYGQKYDIFGPMVARAFNRCDPRHKQAHRYFDRGIRIHKEWMFNKIAMKKYLMELWLEQTKGSSMSLYGPDKNQLSLDRINNDKGYEPGNLRFATKVEQARK